jgi:Ni,Fe-hydrogenase III small subunit/NAD-dependent dihydropyrimidine dehydrogenase PreA subunit
MTSEPVVEVAAMNLIRARLRQGNRTMAWPDGPVALPQRFRGRPILQPALCPDGCRLCADACPTAAIQVAPLRLDLGRCLLCPACADACPTGAVRLSNDIRLAVSTREDLVFTGAGQGSAGVDSAPAGSSGDATTDEDRLARALPAETRRLFGRSLKLRQVSAGGCNGCEADLNVTGIVVFDLGRFGVQFVASPRHADGIVVTGPVTANMRQALLDTWDAMPSPRLVIAVGACALSGGPFAGSPACGLGLPPELPVDLFIPGCPPHPVTFLDGILRMLGRM